MAQEYKQLYSDFDQYIRQGEPGPSEKAAAWQAAIGLQDVDGLQPSAYLVDTAKRHIEGDITIDQVKGLIDTYYKSRQGRLSAEEERTEEADKVSARITELLQEETFSFTPAEFQRIHRKLFEGIFKFAGKYRNFNISKKEWVLDGDSVLYNPFENLKETLDYDFAEERKFDYSSASIEDSIRHIAAFIAGIWQIHPFAEGNTRTTAVASVNQSAPFQNNKAVMGFARTACGRRMRPASKHKILGEALGFTAAGRRNFSTLLKMTV